MENWNVVFDGIIPQDNYQTQITNGEDKGLIIELKSNNHHVIMKMDRDNFIIFPEYDDGEEGIQIPFSLSIYKNRLLDAINSYAQEKGII